MRLVSHSVLRLLAATLVLTPSLGLITACGDDAQVVARQVRDYVANVGTSDGRATGALVQGAPPEPSGGPDANVEIGEGTVLMGGGSMTTISADVPFATILLAIGGADGYYRIMLPIPVESVELAVMLADEIPDLSFLFRYALIDVSGAVGAFVGQTIDVQRVIESDVQVGLSWGTPADLNLTVTDASGATLSAAMPSSPESGATHYGDAMAGCARTASTTELVAWPFGRAPTGTYQVEVSLAGVCDASGAGFVLVIGREGQQPLVVPGQLSLLEGAPPFTFGFDYERSGGGETGCGDRTCDDGLGETCSTCPTDCGACDACSIRGTWIGGFEEDTGAIGTIEAELLQDGTGVFGTTTVTVTSCPSGGEAFCSAGSHTDATISNGNFDGSAIQFTSGFYTFTGAVEPGCTDMGGTFSATIFGGDWALERTGDVTP